VLYDKVCRDDVLRIAYLRVKANGGAPGVDHQTFEVIEKEIGVDTFLRSIQEQLLKRRYRPLPVRRVYIPKADGAKRPLGIPVITDRVVQAAVKIVIEPLFEANFKDFSYGFRPRKSAHQALREVYERLKSGCRWVVDADIKSYFDRMPHDRLLLSVRSRVIDRSVVKLIQLWLEAGLMEEMQVRKETTGTPQGGVISPLLANLYLHWLDRYWERKGFGGRAHNAHLVRYADDFVILCRARPEVYLAAAKAVLDRLGLALNEQKTRVVDARKESFDFLGNRFIVQPSKRTGAIWPYHYPAPRAMNAVKKKIREAVRGGQHRNLPDLIRERINPLLRGWGTTSRPATRGCTFCASPTTRLGRSPSCCGRNTRSGQRDGGTIRRLGFTTTTAYSSSTVWWRWLIRRDGMAILRSAVMLSDERQSESRVRENRTHGLTRGC
jgi:group II intron reverse transcriptase/maturase